MIDWKKLDEEPYQPLADYARFVGAEGAVLIKNDNELLPITNGKVISVFGRMQVDYYMSGLGSGGLVNTPYYVNIIDGIENNPKLNVNTKLADVYRMWCEENPTTVDYQWTPGVWSKPEMPIDDELVMSAREISDIAVIVIGRMAGETRDNDGVKGCWYLSDEEEALLETVSKYFENTVVLLNTSNIIGMDWIEKYNIKSVVYLWLGGQEGGNAAADILSGDNPPGGRLTDTIAKDITLYPSTKNFGDAHKNIYQEDIYVGYRYFETFAKEEVIYPFGYGLSYTDFEIMVDRINETKENIIIDVTVKNIGNFDGKEVVQIYFSAPQGKLGKSARELCAFKKTDSLKPADEQKLTFEIQKNKLSSYDDSGITGNKSCYVLEAGEYSIYVGNNVRDAKKCYSFEVEDLVVTEELTEALSPSEAFQIIYPKKIDGKYEVAYRDVHIRETNYHERIKSELPGEIIQTGDTGIKLIDVKEGKNTIDEFVAQLSDEELMCIVKGEGMCSPKVRPGTTGIFGGTSHELNYFGIPVAVACDGPSGIRLDNGDKATSIPCGTAIACTWNEDIAQEIYELLSIELCTHHVDTLLGPGINIHRSPLCGRNFEYYSEDPFLTGKIAAAQSRGMAKYGNTTTIKHYAANSQEFKRSMGNSVVSERALREIYLKGFEIAVKEGGVKSIMTAYNLINGIWCLDNYDLNTTILRNEWGYTGVVMTDWWAGNVKKTLKAESYLRQLVESQNDVYMVTNDAKTHEDDLPESLADGKITRGQLQRNAINILRFLMETNSFERFIALGGILEKSLSEDLEHLKIIETVENVESGKEIECAFDRNGRYLLAVEYLSAENELIQMVMNVHMNGISAGAKTVNGTNNELQTVYIDISVVGVVGASKKTNSIKLEYPTETMKVMKIEIMSQK